MDIMDLKHKEMSHKMTADAGDEYFNGTLLCIRGIRSHDVSA